MEIFQSIIGQDKALSALKQDILLNSVTHAYLFLGPEGIGKKTMAKSFAKAIICPKGGCSCNTCSRIEKALHPDFVQYSPEGNFLTIEQIREIIRLVTIEPLEAKRRIVVIERADSMTEPAYNAILKTLEEPPEFNIFILIAANTESMPPTIVSRCRVIKFNTIDSHHIEKILMERFSIKDDKAKQISRLSGGILATALNLCEDPWHFKLRDLVLRQACEQGKTEELELFLSKLMVQCREPGEKSASKNQKKISTAQEFAINQSHLSHLKKVLDKKGKRETSRLNLAAFEEALDYLASWYRDLLTYIESKSSDLLINLDYFDEIQKSCQNVDVFDIIKKIEKIQQTQKLLRLNVNAQLALEDLFMSIG